MSQPKTLSARIQYWIDRIFNRNCWRYRRSWSSSRRQHVSDWMMYDIAKPFAERSDDQFANDGVIEYKHQPEKPIYEAPEVWL